MNRSFSPYWDKFGLLVQKSGDGGDTLNRMAHYAIGNYLNNEENQDYVFYKIHRYLHNGKGVFRRHPDKKMWYSDWDRATRDQLTPLVIACALHNKYDLLGIMLKKTLLNFFFTQKLHHRNVWKDKVEHEKKAPKHRKWTDSTFRDTLFSHIPLYIRAYRCYYLYPVLLLFDLDLLGGAIIKTVFGKYNRKVRGGDDLNFISEILFAQKRIPTPISCLARKIYKHRPHMKDLNAKYNMLEKDYETDSGPQSALQYYCTKKEYDTCPLDLLYQPSLERL